MKAKRIIKNVDVKFISLVPAGANQKRILWKGEGMIDRYVEFKKTDDEKHLVFGIVYSPDEVDTQGDTATAETIENMAHSFMRNGRTTQIDKNHDSVPDEGYIAESWIVRAGDPVFGDQPEGSWAVAVKVENADTWESVKKGELKGLSMAGIAAVEDIEKKGVLTKIRDLFAGEPKAEEEPEIEKAGKMLSTANLEILNEIMKKLEELLAKVNSTTEETQKAAAETKAIEGIVEAFRKDQETIAQRVEALETKTPGSAQQSHRIETDRYKKLFI